jgi:hypothetical protein
MRTLLRTVTLGTVLALIPPAARLAGQAPDPVIGTWKLNLVRSSPGQGSETRTYVAVGKDIKATAKGVDAKGKPYVSQWSFSADYDGTYRPLTGDPQIETIAIRRIDAFGVEFTEKKAGKVVYTGTRLITRDGKVMTITERAPQGDTSPNVMVFDKR